MRNYLFDRSQEPALPFPPPAGAAVLPKKHRRRGALVAALFCVLIIALTVLALVLERLAGSLPDNIWGSADGGWFDSGDNHFGILPGIFQDDTQDVQTTIPRTPLGTDVRMTVVEHQGDALSATEIYNKVLPSVVSVRAFGNGQGGTASGVVLSSDGYIITNNHVVEGMQLASVSLLTDGSSYSATLVGRYPDMDLAVLKIDATDLIPAEFGSSRLLKPGETVYAIGNPMGYLYGSISDGIVSSINRTSIIDAYDVPVIQTTAALNPGNSGGALVNAWGQVVGITFAKIDPPSDVTIEALGLAIPVCEARRCVNTLLRTGEMEDPVMGILCQTWGDGDGVLVVEVTEGGPAEAAGLLPGDVLLSANGAAVGGVEELKDVIYDTGVGGELRCTLLRDGEELELGVILTAAG